MPSITPWSDDQNIFLKKHHEEGLSASQIAIKLNREFGINKTRNAVIGRLHRLGLSNDGRAVMPRRSRAMTQQQKIARIVARKANGSFNSQGGSSDTSEAVEPFLRLPILDLKNGQCRYAVDYAENTHLFCGLPADAKPYCEHHARICYGVKLSP